MQRTNIAFAVFLCTFFCSVRELEANICWGFGYSITAPQAPAWGTLTSPSYPTNYGSGLSCNWFLKASGSDQRVAIYFEVFGVHNDAAVCRSDYVLFRDGKTIIDWSPPLAKFCGNTLPPYILSSGRYLTVYFKSKTYKQYKGFVIRFQSVNKDQSTPWGPNECSETRPFSQNQGLQNSGSSSGSLYSPDYPTSYAGNMQCSWTITVSSGQTIKLTSTDMDVHGSGDCSSGSDVISVYNGNAYATKLGDFCGTNAFTVTSSGKQLFIRFKSDNRDEGAKGFVLKYEAQGLSTGVIAGIAVGVLIVVIIVIVVIVCIVKANTKKSQGHVNPNPPDTTTMSTNVTNPIPGVSIVNAGVPPPPYTAQQAGPIMYTAQVAPTVLYGGSQFGAAQVVYGNQPGVTYSNVSPPGLVIQTT